MSPSLTIRKMAAFEIDIVTSIYEEVLEPSYISFSELNEGKAEEMGKLSDRAVLIFRRQLLELHQNPLHGFFIAEMQNSIVGFALSSISIAEAGHMECWLDDIGVKHTTYLNPGCKT